MTVEVRIISGPAAMLRAEVADCRPIGGATPAIRADKRPQELGGGETFGAVASVAETHLPSMLGLIDDKTAKAVLNTAQGNPRTNVVQAPKVS